MYNIYYVLLLYINLIYYINLSYPRDLDKINAILIMTILTVLLRIGIPKK